MFAKSYIYAYDVVHMVVFAHLQRRSCWRSPWVFGSSVRFFGTYANLVSQKKWYRSVPKKNSVPRKFSIGKFGSVSVFTEQYQTNHRDM
jgi:hypothetical protein